MTGNASKIPLNGQELGHDFVKKSNETEGICELIFDFLDEGLEFHSSECSLDSSISYSSGEIINEEDDENVNNSEENKAFWASQGELLQTTLCRTTSFESRVRKATKEALNELKSTGINCSCKKMVADSCRKCTQKEISQRLRNAGYNCSICKSKWKSSPEMPSGEHTYMEVMQSQSSKKGEIMKVIIELNFRGEFEMARANEEYNDLVKKLPEVYVGKIERLRNLIKILCCASKKCMKEKKMHMAPWRKHKYMQAKYIGTPEMKPEPFFPAVNNLQRLVARPRAYSMLTFDLLDSLPPPPRGLYSTAIKVV
ncbi:uncharacterized protein LOC107810252 [Nicotiana tabacum]|uniref:Uncharacterized protein LOC107810252 n=2 Tax=Nicotiana TaxID=4085 RepID=A0A1S4BNP8_TOBAC|nr:PREDICTED: uncharacterized protein LOC104236464 [Nicotiana sylvestris]XP_016490493.1 PREDICTED: uncharacterized protein LOC107810252 [Nicotiana tabacum]